MRLCQAGRLTSRQLTTNNFSRMSDPVKCLWVGEACRSRLAHAGQERSGRAMRTIASASGFTVSLRAVGETW